MKTQAEDKPDDLSKFAVASGKVAEQTYEMVPAKPEGEAEEGSPESQAQD